VLLHHLFGEAAGVEGAWGHAIGGMGSITQAMARAVREQGVDIVLNTPVEEIIVERGRVGGRRRRRQGLAIGIVVAGVNPKLLFDRLVPEGAVEPDAAQRRMHAWRCESATFRMNVALSELPKFTVLPKKGDHLTAGIIIAPSLDYMDAAYVDAKVNGWSAKAGHRNGDSLDARSDAGAQGQACRLALLPAFPLRPRAEAKLGQGTRESGRRDHRDNRCARPRLRRSRSSAGRFTHRWTWSGGSG
jgi:hypothetical protein